MKKLLLGAAIIGALTATGAQAVINVDANGVPIINPVDTNILYLSGASAAEKFIEKVITDATVPAANRICDTAAQKVYKFQDTPAAPATSGAFQFAYLCQRVATNANLPTNKLNILIYKRSDGGSAFGVSPIVSEANGDTASATIEFLKISSACTVRTPAVLGGAMGVIDCAYDKADPNKHISHISDFGISDVDPAQFTGNNSPINPATGVPYPNVTSDDVAKLTVKSASALMFGVPVTKNLYFALQAAQKSLNSIPATCTVPDEREECMPSLTSAQVASIHAGALVNWNQLKVGAVGLYDWVNTPANGAGAYLPGAGPTGINGPDPAYVHTCRRENGSGTQAQSNIKFLLDPCSAASSGTPPASDAAAQGFEEGDGVAMIHENNSSGVVDQCLSELQDGDNGAASSAFVNTWGKRWAVGIQSLEKKTSATATDASGKYRFVKLDGVSPKLLNVNNGKYRDWVENTFQYFTSHVFSANVTENTALKKLTDAVIASSGAPQVMAALNNGFTHTFTTEKGAYLAVPTNYTIEPNGAFNSARPVNPYSHATAAVSVNNCRVPTVYNDGSTDPISGAVSGDSQL